ncbi:hypothetical protein AJ78_01775 [Emergomyces pasteurianus Ep9510]|uniref:Uncharacterized protein n=1 Tax=Emergomyces pasteurianus Ep9510 TaxID=1447872 RepID=A0A1J9QD89_9EURO|nr:hypothetical protein AJ78_01775 [Emergomyces pasteurianus Ep9510]
MTSYRHLINSSAPPTPGDSNVELTAVNTHLNPEHGSRTSFNLLLGERNPVSSQNAVTLSREPSYVVMSSIWDFCLAIVPVTFIVIGILAASLDGDMRSKRGDQIKEATTLIPTMFPIIFAALVGYFFRIYGTFRAERGIRLGTLEQLIGSNSFFSAFERQMLLRDFGLIGLIIMAVWALSPIGGQAGLRLLSTSLQSVPYNTTNWYLSPLSIADTSLQGTSAMQTSGDLITSLYTSSMMGSETTAGTGMDLWGNVKIPDINSLKVGENSSDWRIVDWNSTVQFTSLLGLPVGRPMSEGNMTFTVTSHHFDVQCTNNIRAEKQDLAVLSYNMVNGSSGPGHSMLTYFAEAFPAMTDEVGGDTSSRAKFMFGSRTQWNGNHTWGLSNCTLGNLAVDSRVECQSESCRVQAMRPSQRVENFEGLNHFINFTLNYLPTATDRDKSTNYLYSATLTERWMNDTSLLFRGGRIDMDLWKLDPKVLSSRLETALNSFWQGSFAKIYRGTSLPKDSAMYEALENCSTDKTPLYCFVPVEANGVRHTGEVYKCDRAWFAVFLMICLVLQTLALASIILKRITLAPDILGFVSSYTRDNPHAPVSAGSFHDGLVRTRLLKDVRVMLGDVRSAEQVGHISFVAEGDTPIGRLKKGRKYI